MDSDVYGKTLKTRLKTIMTNDVYRNRLLYSVYKANDIRFICGYFTNSYILHCFDKNLDIPAIDENFFKISFKVLSKSSVGPKPKGNNLILFNKLSEYFVNEFVNFLPSPKREFINDNKFDSQNLSYVFSMFAKEMEVSNRNNIILNFFKYINQFVNQNFIKYDVPKLSKIEFNKLSYVKQIEYRQKRADEFTRIKDLKKELMYVKNDLAEETLKSDKKYHKWINEHKKIIFPEKEDDDLNYEDDILINHNKYLKHMLLMNKYLENTEDSFKKLFTALPLRTEITDKYVQFDSTSIRDIFNSLDLKSVPADDLNWKTLHMPINVNGTAKITNEKLWKMYFDINFQKFKIKGYSFNYLISTDGVAVSINFINNNKIDSKNNKIKAMTSASREAKKAQKNMSSEEILKKKNDKKEQDKVKAIERTKKAKEIRKAKKEEFDKLTKEEKDEIRLKLKLASNKFEYIEDAIKDPDLFKIIEDAFIKGLIKVADPGSRDLLTILGMGFEEEYTECDENNPIKKRKKWGKKLKKVIKRGKNRKGKILYSYRSGRRLKETRRLKNKRLIDNKKKSTIINTNSIEELERGLTNCNSKTVKFEKFKEYAKLKIQMRLMVSNYEEFKIDATIREKNRELRNEITKEKLKSVKIDKGDKTFLEIGTEYNRYMTKLKWYSYVNKKRHEDNILNEIEKVYGKEAIFIIGDWGGKGKIHRISTPNMGLKRLLSKRFKVFLIDEFRTSILHHETENKCENLIREIKYEKDEKEHVYKKKEHSVLTFKKSKQELGCINRDYNACLNMYKIVKGLIETKKRPERYDRSLKIKID